MKRLTQIFVLVAFMFSCGGQWYVLQCVAWINMIHEYSQFVPLGEAVSMTFSGKYPCALCRAIAEKKESERVQFFAMDKYEKKFFPPLAIAAVEPQIAPVHYPEFLSLFQTRSDSPPTPPPRLFLD